MKEISLVWRRHAIRAIFFLSGFGAASWAPLVPIVKRRLAVSDDVMGMLLLCIGIGSMLSMPFSGSLSQKYGCRKILIIAATVFTAGLFGISQVNSVYLLVPMLLMFGAAMGSVDVVMNIAAVLVEKMGTKSVMSNFHSMWSIGCFAGSGLFGLWLLLGASVTTAAAIAVIVMLLIILGFNNKWLETGGDVSDEKAPLVAIPEGIVIFLGIMTCISFLVEGAVMDWGGIFITDVHGLDIALAGTGFTIYSVAMFLCRFTGDYAVNRWGQKKIVLGGITISCLGYLLLVVASSELLVFASFFLIGIGLSNVVPVVYSLSGRQRDMASAQAAAAIGVTGYTGILGGPAIIGFISNATSLNVAFIFICLLIVFEFMVARHIFASTEKFE